MIVLIESDWNLKHAMMDIDIAAISINRLRLEFKVTSGLTMKNEHAVLIESDWNLKDISPDSSPRLHGVLIESYWNLRII